MELQKALFSQTSLAKLSIVIFMSCFRWGFYLNIDFSGGGRIYFDYDDNVRSFEGHSFNNVITSIRRIGASTTPFTTSSLTLFEHPYTGGRSFYRTSSTSYVGNSFNDITSSIVMTGSDYWTVYK